LCLFDVSGTTPSLLFRSIVPGGGTCGSEPCWRANRSGTGFVYSGDGSDDGTRLLRVSSSAGARSRVRFSGRGPGLRGRPFGLPAIPLSSVLRLELRADGGACLGASYRSDGVRRNDGARGTYRARSATSP